MAGTGYGPQGGQVTVYRGPAARPVRGGIPPNAVEGPQARSSLTQTSFTATYDATLSRVQLNASGLTGSPVTAIIDRSTDQLNWTTVRGASAVSIVAGATTFPTDDYEFPPDVLIYYRLRSYTSGAVLIQTLIVSIKVTLSFIWLKFITAPYLNRRVTLTNWSPIARASRTGIFNVVSRREPVVVTDLHSTRKTTISLATASNDESLAVDLALSLGVPMLLQIPADGSCDLPTMYVAIGDYEYTRESVLSHRGKFSIPLTESAAPPASVTGSPGSWQTVLSNYATWNALLIDPLEPTWAAVAQLLGSASDIIVAA